MPMPADWSRLRSRLRGTLITPGDAIYDDARQVFNARIQQRPTAIARVLGEADVVACVRFCMDHEIAITPRCGGHGAEGYCSRDDSLMIDLSALQSIEVDLKNRLVIVGGGCTWGQVDLATYPRGLAAPGGGCVEVGVGGLTLGGGLGPISRSCGLTIDSLVRARVVTSLNPRATVVDANTEPDLFWALRGGGGGNFGVVTSFAFKLQPIGHAFAAGAKLYNWKDAKTLLKFYRNWMQSAGADRRLTLMPILAFNGDNRPIAVLSVFYNGDPNDGFANIDRILAEFGAPTPEQDMVSAMTLPAYTAGAATTAFPGLGQFWKSGFLRNDFDDTAIDTMLTWFDKAPREGARPLRGVATQQGTPDLTFAFIESLGGTISDVGETDTAFYWRNNLFSFTFIGIYNPAVEGWGQQTEEWAKDFRRAMEPHLSSGVYVNYMQEDLPNFKYSYYGGNCARLEQAKKLYDPVSAFVFPQGLNQGSCRP